MFKNTVQNLNKTYFQLSYCMSHGVILFPLSKLEFHNTILTSGVFWDVMQCSLGDKHKCLKNTLPSSSVFSLYNGVAGFSAMLATPIHQTAYCSIPEDHNPNNPAVRAWNLISWLAFHGFPHSLQQGLCNRPRPPPSKSLLTCKSLFSYTNWLYITSEFETVSINNPTINHSTTSYRRGDDITKHSWH